MATRCIWIGGTARLWHYSYSVCPLLFVIFIRQHAAEEESKQRCQDIVKLRQQSYANNIYVCMSELILVGANLSTFEGSKTIYMPNIGISMYLQ